MRGVTRVFTHFLTSAMFFVNSSVFPLIWYPSLDYFIFLGLWFKNKFIWCKYNWISISLFFLCCVRYQTHNCPILWKPNYSFSVTDRQMHKWWGSWYLQMGSKDYFYFVKNSQNLNPSNLYIIFVCEKVPATGTIYLICWKCILKTVRAQDSIFICFYAEVLFKKSCSIIQRWIKLMSYAITCLWIIIQRTTIGS